MVKIEDYGHFIQSIQWLNETWKILNDLKNNKSNILYVPAFRYAIIAYAKPYKNSRINDAESKRLDDAFVPNEFKEVHKKLIRSRDKRHAHLDINELNLKIMPYNIEGDFGVSTSMNRINPLDDTPELDEFIKLIEGTVDNMRKRAKEMQLELCLI